MARIKAKDIAKEVYAMSALVGDLYGEKSFLEITLRNIDLDSERAKIVRAQLQIVVHLIKRYEENRQEV